MSALEPSVLSSFHAHQNLAVFKYQRRPRPSSSSSALLDKKTMAHLYLPPANGKKPPPWRGSPAKKMLRKGIIAGDYPESMSNEAIYGSSLEFRQYKWKDFNTNIKNLREAIKISQAKADRDAAAFVADRNRPPAAGATPLVVWAGSQAEKSLIDDVDHGRHLLMKPKALRATRPEYGEWSLKSFRDHIQQELKNRKTQAYWLHRKKNNIDSSSEPWPTINSK